MSDAIGPGPQRKVIANVVVSIDGCIAAEPDDGMGGMGWLVAHAVHEQTRAHFEGIYRGASTALLGRTNYEGFFGYWPPVARDPDADPRDHDFASWLDAVEKVVFSRTLTSTDWQNARVAADLEAEVSTLKSAPGRDILVLSSASIIQALMEHDLLDELHVAVLPAVLGSGLRLFPEAMSPSTWQLAGTTTFPTGASGCTTADPDRSHRLCRRRPSTEHGSLSYLPGKLLSSGGCQTPPERGGGAVPYGYIGSMKTKPGHRDDVVTILLSGVDDLRSAGCELYVVSLSDAEDDTIWVSEVWQTKGHHDASLQLPEVKAAIDKAMPMLTGEFTSQELTVVGGLGV